MTFDDWFMSKQGTPYDSMYMFAKDAWIASAEQCALICEKRGNENRLAEGKPNGDRDEFYCADDIRRSVQK